MREFNVAITITHHEGPLQIDGVFTGGALQQAWLGLSAVAGVVGGVRAIVDRGEMRACGGELLGHKIVDLVHHGFREHAAAYAGLIGDDDDRQVRVVQPTTGTGREGKQIKLAELIQVADFFGDGAVAIEEDGWPEEDRIRQGAPRWRLARIGRWW